MQAGEKENIHALPKLEGNPGATARDQRASHLKLCFRKLKTFPSGQPVVMETFPRRRFCNCTIKSHRGRGHKYTDANCMFRFADASSQTTMAVIIPPLLPPRTSFCHWDDSFHSRALLKVKV